MKARCSVSPLPDSGYALLMVIIVVAACALILGGTLGRTRTAAVLNQRNNQYTTGLYAAEAATEKVFARMKYDYLLYNLTGVTNNLAIYRSYIPTATENPYWSRYEFSDGQGNLNVTGVRPVSTMTYTGLQSQYYGLSGWQTIYRVLSNVRDTTSGFAITNAVQQDIEMDNIPVYQYAIFYNSLAEFTWAAPLTVNGRTHANGSIFVGSSSPLTFNALVTATGIIVKSNWAGHVLSDYTGAITYKGTPGYSTNCQVLQLPIGTNNSASAVREVVNIPPGGEDVNSAMGQQRFYNKAGVVLLVSNSTVTTVLKTTPSDTSTAPITYAYSATNYSAINTNLPFLSITNTFTDQRENSKLVRATQIDVGVLRNYLATNSTITTKFSSGSGYYPNIMYVADFRTTTGTSNGTEMTAVRLVNGTIIPTNNSSLGAPTGFTLATPDPLYVKGNYNCPNSSALNTTNTSQTFPASLVSDSLTILSANWQDSASSGSFASRDAVSTTVNAAILTGVVYSTGAGTNQFSGGVMNLPRLLEDWGNGGSITLTLNTSIVNFYNSVKATNQFKMPGIYYYAPTRQFSFDSNFKDYSRLPPGTPMLGAVMRAKFTVPPANSISYAGN